MKAQFITSSISAKDAIKMKRFKKTKAPCTITHHIHFNDGSQYEAIVDFLPGSGGFNEDQIIKVINGCIQSVKGARCISVEFVSIVPYVVTPSPEYSTINNVPVLPVDKNKN